MNHNLKHFLVVFLSVLLTLTISACSNGPEAENMENLEEAETSVEIETLEEVETLEEAKNLEESEKLEDLEAWDLVWISDSSGWGVAEIYGAMVAEDTGKEVLVHDNWIGGLSAGEVLGVLNGKPTQNFRLEKLPELIRDAEIIVFYGNPEQSINPDNPGDWNCTGMSYHVNNCNPEIFNMYIQNLKEIYEHIFELRSGKETIILTFDAYNPLINLYREQDVFDECRECWRNYNAAIYEAAEAYDIPVGQIIAAWNGGLDLLEDPNEKGYTKDGIHPNEAGAEVIAQAMRDLGYTPMIP